ncbi:MAG: hypothetical protein ACE5IH_08910 [Thermodesulfobacteriota bacterium]
MKDFGWQILLALSLILLSTFLYSIHYAIFKDLYHIAIYLIGDIAFLPIEVLLVTLIIHRLLNEREKRAKLEKLNIVIGVFFSEVGDRLLTYFSDSDPELDKIRRGFIVTKDWSGQEFLNISKLLKGYDYSVEIQKLNLEHLHGFVSGKRDFLLRLLENPNLLEHESFTELLQTVFHLTKELENREDFKRLPNTDIEHLAGDVKRAYIMLVNEWLDYMKHMKNNYPYLFSPYRWYFLYII